MLENYDAGPIDGQFGEEDQGLSRGETAQIAVVAKWARYAGISMLSLFGVLTLLFLYTLIRSGEAIFTALDNWMYYAGFWEWIGLIIFLAYVVVAVVIAFKLLTIGKKAQVAADTGLPQRLEFALEELALFYKIIGIVLAVSFVYGIISWLVQSL